MNLYKITMYIIYFASVILIFRAVKKSFFSKLITFDDYVNRSKHFVMYFKNRTAAINVLKKALENKNISNVEKNELKIKIGILYNYKKEYAKAKLYFDEVLDYIKKEKLEFDRELASIVVVYYNLGDKETARKVYHWLRSKEKYEPRFELFSYLDNYIFK
ncbi:MAG: hypothetical protein ACRDA4_09625 [Filifactoraceae bacterium]